jgi:alkanesulfonate monooxygenase SsuD/methylene tetrahydromethanopterin reductase-like flavin-dependent oxidoreductase (luciferase family)
LPANGLFQPRRLDRCRALSLPVPGIRIPIVLGGNGDASLARVAAFGDGWYGFNLSVAAVPERLATLTEQRSLHNRNPAT